jgi:glycosyltransferase involved in cell wall biosynthesis
VSNGILHIISGLGVGGAEATLLQIAGGLRHRNFHQHVVCLSDLDTHAEELVRSGVETTILGLLSPLDFPPKAYRLLHLAFQLKPRIVQGWMYHGNLVAYLIHRLMPGRKDRRLLWNLRASNMDDERYGRLLHWSAKISGAPNVIIVNSSAGATFHLSRGYRPRRIEVIHNGIDTKRFVPNPTVRARLRTELGIPSDAKVAIHVARTDPMKNQAMFIETMAKLPRITGLLVGAGTEFLSLPQNCRALGLRRDVADLYAVADLVVSTSAFGEGFSNVIAEGMSAGLIPVATDVGDARDLVGETGFVIPPGDMHALLQVLEVSTEIDQHQRDALAMRARNRIIEQFSRAKSIDRYAKLYSDFL